MHQDFKMIQNFDVQGGPDFGRTNLPKLRKALSDANLDGFIIPHEDEYQNEYLPDCNERLMWVCLLYTSPSPRDKRQSRMPSSA